MTTAIEKRARIGLSLKSLRLRREYAVECRRMLGECSAPTPEAVRAVEELEAQVAQIDLFGGAS